MVKYRFLEDIATADIAFEAWGETFEELFKNCAMALMEVMADTTTVSPSLNEKLNLPAGKAGIKSEKLENLLFDFLSELVFLKDRDQILFSRFELEIKKLTTKDYQLKASMWGEKIDPQKHHLRVDVKAVTWHMFQIAGEKDNWKARVVLDI